MSRLTRESLADTGMGPRTSTAAATCSRWASCTGCTTGRWTHDRTGSNDYFGVEKKKPEIAEINIKALKAGYYFGETAELFSVRYKVPPPSTRRVPTGA
jgi:hypothetical protein